MFNEYSGQYKLFNGVSIMYLSMTFINHKSEYVAKKTWTVRRLISEYPEKLSINKKNIY